MSTAVRIDSHLEVLMKLGIWIKANGLTQETFVQFSRNQGAGFSKHAVAKWCAGSRVPRPDEMRVIYELTNRQVQPNDFYGLPAENKSPIMG